MSWLVFIIVGMLAGAIASRLVAGKGYGILFSLVIGVVGALVGKVIFDLAGLTASGLVGQLIVATVGAVAVLLIANFVKGK